MRDLGEALEANIEQVVERWVTAVWGNDAIPTAQQLTHQAVRNSLPEVLRELARLLSLFSQQPDTQTLEDRSFFHGLVRAQQGYNAAEIVREYQLLREGVLDALEPELLTGSTAEVLRAMRLVDSFLREIVTASLESYIAARLTELEQIQSHLHLTNQELNRLLQAQKDTLSIMAHELKNPLNSIIGHSNLLLQQQRQKLQSSETDINLAQLERVLRNGRRLLKIVNDALEISRYDRGQIGLELGPVNPALLIREILEDVLEPAAAAKAIALDLDIAAAPTEIISDELRLQQVVTNLVSNAIRYTEQGQIRVIAAQGPSHTWSLTVADTGIGIAPEHQSSIFEPYNQVAALSALSEGSGLGLAIVKQIVDLMAGTIELDSQVGIGTTLVITLPVIPPQSELQSG